MTIYQLTDFDLREKKVQLDGVLLSIEERKMVIDQFNKILEKKIPEKLAKRTLKEMEEQLKKGKIKVNGEERDLHEDEIEELKIKIETQKEWVKKDMQTKKMRQEIKMHQISIERDELYKVRPLRKQIREKQIVQK